MFLLLAAGAARAEDPSGDKGLTTYAIAMHGQPALPADFSRLPYADFGLRPLSRAYRPFIGPPLKGSKGSIVLKNPRIVLSPRIGFVVAFARTDVK